MEPSSQETDMSSQPNQGPSLSALIDAIALQEQSFEQSLANQQLWAKQVADAQEAKIKAAFQQVTFGAAEVSEVRLGKNVVTPEVKPEDVISERGTRESEPQLQPPSWQFSRSKLTSLSQHPEPEVHKENRRYALDSVTRYDHHKDHQKTRNYHRVSRNPKDDSNPHHGRAIDSVKHRETRGASPLEGSWKRGRSPSKSKPQRYCHEDSYSPRSGRYHDSIPHYRRPIVGEKHRERRRASPGERSRKRERSPTKTKLHDDSQRARNYRRSPGDDSNRCHGRSFDSRRYREKRGASPSEMGKSHRSRHIPAEDQNDGHGNNCDAEIGEPTGRKSECRSKRAADANSRNYTTSESLNAKAPHSASVCANNPQNHPA